MCLRIALVCCCLFGLSLSYRNGAPLEACYTLEPDQPPPQRSQPPFAIRVNNPEISQGEHAVVSIGGSISFRGFIVQAREYSTGRIINGAFTVGEGTKTLNCANGHANTATHSNNYDKSTVTLHWNPPSGYTGNVVFNGAVVHNGATHWTGLSSNYLTVQ